MADPILDVHEAGRVAVELSRAVKDRREADDACDATWKQYQRALGRRADLDCMVRDLCERLEAFERERGNKEDAHG